MMNAYRDIGHVLDFEQMNWHINSREPRDILGALKESNTPSATLNAKKLFEKGNCACDNYHSLVERQSVPASISTTSTYGCDAVVTINQYLMAYQMTFT